MSGRGKGVGVPKRRWNRDDVLGALEALEGSNSMRQVARNLGIPFATLADWKRKGPDIKLGSGGQTVLSRGEENVIVDALVWSGKMGFPQGRDELKDMVQSYVNSSGKRTPFTHGRPGKDWTRAFEDRHKASIRRRIREGLSQARADALATHNVQTFYDMWEDLLVKHELLDKPWLLWNVDETGLSADKCNQKVYVGRTQRNAYSIQSMGTKTMYTVLFCCSAIGTYLPPYTLYKAQSLWESWCEGGAPGALYGVSDSGWMFDKNFEAWFIKAFEPLTRDSAAGGLQHRVLVYDGHNSHITYPTVKHAIDNNISICCLPPHTSHALQPLDVGVFRSVKVNYKEACLGFFKNNRRSTIGKSQFPKLIAGIWLQLKGEHPRSGFRKCGLWPIDKAAVNNKILVTAANAIAAEDIPSNAGPRHPSRVLHEAILAVLTPARETPKPTKPRKRVPHKAGEILTHADSVERLRLEKEERDAKALAGPKGRKKAGGVSIQFSCAPSTSAANNAVIGGKGTLDGWLAGDTRTVDDTPSVDSAELQEQEVTKALGRKRQSGIKAFFADPSPAKRSKKEVAGPYREASSTEDDPDDPESSSDSEMPQGMDLVRKLVPGVTHVIFNREGQHFPGMVLKVSTKKGNVLIRHMLKSGQKTWQFAAKKLAYTCKLRDITDFIPPPELANSRGNYFVSSKIAKWWPEITV